MYFVIFDSGCVPHYKCPSTLAVCVASQMMLSNLPNTTEIDSWNLLVPHSGCKGSVDLYKEYADVRGPDLAIPKDELHQIKVPAGTQPCDVMGIHPSLPYLKQLYDEGDALMIANMGGLVEVSAWVRRVGIERNRKRRDCFQNRIFPCPSNIHLYATTANDAGRIREKDEKATKWRLWGLFVLAKKS